MTLKENNLNHPIILPMKKIFSSIALLSTLAFAYTAADVYGVWSMDGKVKVNAYVYTSPLPQQDPIFDKLYMPIVFDENSLNNSWRFQNGKITYPNSYTWCQLISAKTMDCNIQIGYGTRKITYKKAATIAQYRKDMEKYEKEQASETVANQKKAKLEANPFYLALNKARANLEKMYNELDNSKKLAKGEFESTGDFNKRKAQTENKLAEKLKNDTENIFSQELASAMSKILSETAGNMKDILSNSIYDADKQIYELSLKGYGNEYKGRVKMPTEIAKKFKENLGSFSYEHDNLFSADYVIIPKKMRIYDTATKEHYEVYIDIPKNAKEIVFKGSELWLNNPYAKNISKSLWEIKEQREVAKKARAGSINIGGEVYPTVKINNSVWMAKNLNNSECYNNKPENCVKYGGLYDWETAMKACPKGWHLPSKEEWDALIDYAGGEKTAGTKLKATSGWNGDGNGSDAFGFAALPGGSGNSDGDFNYAGYYGYWWSTSENDAGNAYYRNMDYNGEDASWNYYYKNRLYSVRCLQD